MTAFTASHEYSNGKCSIGISLQEINRKTDRIILVERGNFLLDFNEEISHFEYRLLCNQANNVISYTHILDSKDFYQILQSYPL